MLGTGWTPDVVAALPPERRERLLWGIHARRLVEIRDVIAARDVMSPEGAVAKRTDVANIDVLLFPGSIPLPAGREA